MKHNKLRVNLIANIDGKEVAVEFNTVQFTLKVDSYLKSRFEDQSNFDITFDDVKRDFPVLLVDNSGTSFDSEFHSIDLSVQDYDLLLSVYAFFLRYKENATLRRLNTNNDALSSEIQEAQEMLKSIPGIISNLKT